MAGKDEIWSYYLSTQFSIKQKACAETTLWNFDKKKEFEKQQWLKILTK